MKKNLMFALVLSFVMLSLGRFAHAESECANRQVAHDTVAKPAVALMEPTDTDLGASYRTKKTDRNNGSH